MEINELKIQIFDIIRQQEILVAQNNQLDQVKQSLVAKLMELEKTQQGGNIQAELPELQATQMPIATEAAKVKLKEPELLPG